MKKLSLLALFAAFCLAASPVVAETNLTVGAIGSTSDTYMIAMGWANALKKVNSDIVLTPLEGGGTVKLMRGLVSNKWDIGFIGSPHMANALNGELNFAKDPKPLREKYGKVRALFGVASGMAQYVVRGDSDIKSLADLKGRKFAIGTPGGMAGLVTRTLMNEYGLSADNKDYLAQYIDYSAAMDEMRSKLLDATLVWGNSPHVAVFNFSRQIPVRLLPIDKAAFESFKTKMPQGQYYFLNEFSPETLKAIYGENAMVQDAPSNAWTFQMMIIVRDDMPEDVAYELTKTFWENLDTVKETGAALNIIEQKDALKALSIEVHPGAARYYKEKGMM